MPTIAIGRDRATLSPSQLEEIHRLSSGYELLISTDRAVLSRQIDEIEITCAQIPRDLLAKMPKLRWYQQWHAGVDWLTRYPEVRAKDIIITNASGVHPVQITEHVFGLLLAFARALPQSYKAQSQSHWRSVGQQDVFELAGKTMLLIGAGAIGQRIAKLAQAFDMSVIGLRRQPEIAVDHVDRLYGPAELHRLLPEADAIVLTLPLTADTRHMIAAKELELMKKEALLINIGRGGTIDEQALIEVLALGKLAGVGLDVFQNEPLPASSPLWQVDRVIITSHYAGTSPRYDDRAMDIFLDNLSRYRAGEALVNVVDQERGY